MSEKGEVLQKQYASCDSVYCTIGHMLWDFGAIKLADVQYRIQRK